MSDKLTTALAAAITATAFACGGGGGPSCDKVAKHVSTDLADVHFFDHQKDATKLAAQCEKEKWSSEYRSCVHKAENEDGLMDCIEIEVRDKRNRELEAAKNPPPVPELELTTVTPENGSGEPMSYTIDLPANTETKFCGMGGCSHTIPITEEHAYMISVGDGDNVTDLASAKAHAASVVIPPRTVTKAEDIGGDLVVTFGDDPIWSKFVYYKKAGDSYKYAYCRGPLTRGHMDALAKLCLTMKPQ